MFSLSRLRLLSAALAVAVISLVTASPAAAQENPVDAMFQQVQTAIGFSGSDLMTGGIGVFGPLLLYGIAMIVGVGLIWTVVSWFRRGTRAR